MFSMCSELTPRVRIPDTRIPQFMQPWSALIHETLQHIVTMYIIKCGSHVSVAKLDAPSVVVCGWCSTNS